jgi:1-acyl-sn-glycerol-3-phosphate acyltransferase
MAQGDRPGGEGPQADDDLRVTDAGSAARLRLYRGGGARRTRPPRAGTPADVAERLSTLERRVEEALGGSSGEGVARDPLRGALDDALASFVGARRRALRDVQAAWRTWTRLGSRIDATALHAVLAALYQYWWRIEAVGLERVPAAGPAILVTNRGGALVPYEALMIRLALASEHPARRAARPLLEDWIAQLPVLGPGLVGWGALRDGAVNVRRALERGEAVIAYPEGRQALAKPFRSRYRLARFGRAGFARLAIETGAPVVPVAVIGAEEIHPVLARVDVAGRLIGLPTLPITPTFPWLGLAGLVPLPTKWTLLVGEPVDVAARHRGSEAKDSTVVARLGEQVRERLQALVLEGLRRRESLFRG